MNKNRISFQIFFSSILSVPCLHKSLSPDTTTITSFRYFFIQIFFVHFSCADTFAWKRSIFMQKYCILYWISFLAEFELLQLSEFAIYSFWMFFCFWFWIFCYFKNIVILVIKTQTAISIFQIKGFLNAVKMSSPISFRIFQQSINLNLADIFSNFCLTWPFW
jgi:hypothetical protein